jgi:hypothetical protein
MIYLELMFKSSFLLRHSSLQFKRYLHLSIPKLTAGQSQYHGQQGSTWWEKYGSHVDPIQSRLDLLNIDDLDERHFRPVKPVIPSYQSFSCFHDPIISRVIGILLQEGDRELVEELIHKTFRTIKLIQIGKWQRAKTDEERASIECNPVTLLKQAIKNATPIVRKLMKYTKMLIIIFLFRSYSNSKRWNFIFCPNSNVSNTWYLHSYSIIN